MADDFRPLKDGDVFAYIEAQLEEFRERDPELAIFIRGRLDALQAEIAARLIAAERGALCVCRTCGHLGYMHRGVNGACVSIGCPCGPGGWS